MKNLLYLAAIAATAVGFTSCSSEEDLSNAAKDSGVPFKVTASAPTRATDLATGNFTNFQLYAFEGSSTTPWINNVKFTNGSSWTPPNGTTCIWPTAGTASTFYAVSENNSDGTFSGSIGDGAKTFNYTIPTDIATQKDLLVATTTGSSNDASINLQFKHALAAAKLKFTITPIYTAYAGTTYSTYRLHAKINSITFNNVYTSGTYDFTNSAWSNLSTKGSYKITFNTPIEIDTKTSEAKTITVDLSNGSLMFIPQTIDTYWDIAPGKQTASALTPDLNKAYISLGAQTLLYDATSASGSVVSALDYEMANGNPLSITKVTGETDDKNGYFDNTPNTPKKIATLEGEIKDLSSTCVINNANIYDNAYFGDALNVTWVTYDGSVSEPTQDFASNPTYGSLYKAFALATYSTAASVLTVTNSPMTLLNTKNHNLNIDISACVNKATGDGAFGTLGQAGN